MQRESAAIRFAALPHCRWWEVIVPTDGAYGSPRFLFALVVLAIDAVPEAAAERRLLLPLLEMDKTA
jgi:hypothetical protein